MQIRVRCPGLHVSRLLANRAYGDASDMRPIKKAFSYKEHFRNKGADDSEAKMLVVDATVMFAVAALITACATLVWSIRRKP